MLDGPQEDIVRPNLTELNTCNTIYLGRTFLGPDKDELVKCVCGVYRDHLFHMKATIYASKKTHASFNDMDIDQTPHNLRAPGDYCHLVISYIPSLSQITDFL